MWLRDGIAPIESDFGVERVMGGAEACLTRDFQERSHSLGAFDRNRAVQAELCAGFEEFFIVNKQKTVWSETQPTQDINSSDWQIPMPQPTQQNTQRGFEPGPMVLGKSRYLTLIDVLAASGHLNTDVEGLRDRVAEKAVLRVLETLFTLGKNANRDSMTNADPRHILEDLERMTLSKLALEVHASALSSASQINAATPASAVASAVSGALVRTLKPLLKKNNPQLPVAITANELGAENADRHEATSDDTSKDVSEWRLSMALLNAASAQAF